MPANKSEEKARKAISWVAAGNGTIDAALKKFHISTATYYKWKSADAPVIKPVSSSVPAIIFLRQARTAFKDGKARRGELLAMLALEILEGR